MMNLKQLLLLLFCTGLGFLPLHAQLGTTISVDGNLILGPCGDTLLLRGVNYAPYNWGYSPNQLHIDQLAQSGINCVRLPWYNNPQQGTPQSTYGNLENLDSVLSKCIQYQLVPIIELHDLTCQNDYPALTSLANWYVQPDMLALISKYQHSIILNIANEALHVNWTGNPAAAQTAFETTYGDIVNTLRSNGITVPIMIDGPDCGTNLAVLASSGPAMQQNDPAHNLIFSAHAYWFGYAQNDSSQMETEIDNAIASGIPFVLGEIANLQDDQTMCQYSLNYQALLRICQRRNVGWLAWSWDNDGCPDRQISTNGNIANLTTYGNDILFNIDYGVSNFSPARSAYLFHGGSCPVLISADQAADAAVLKVMPNPSNGRFDLSFGKTQSDVELQIFDVQGQRVYHQAYTQVAQLRLDLSIPAGIYWIQARCDGHWLGATQLLIRE